MLRPTSTRPSRTRPGRRRRDRTCPARTRPSRTSPGRGADGYATAEAAVAVPALLVVLSLAVGVVVCVGAQLRCVDAARTAARVAARGDTDALATGAGRAVAPPGAVVTVAHRGGQVLVRVTASVRATRWLPAVRVDARAVVEAEAP